MSRTSDVPTRGRGRPAEAELEARTEALLEASARVFVAHGFSNASYEMIARHANVSTKTIYAWFGGKAGLFAAVVERYAGRIEPRLRAALERHDGEVSAALADAARVIRSFELEPELVAIHRAVIAASGELPEIGATYYRLGPGRGVALLAAYLSTCRDAGRLAVADPVASAEAFIALISRGLLHRRLVRAEDGPLTPEVLDAQVRPALAMFLAAHAATEPEGRRLRK